MFPHIHNSGSVLYEGCLRDMLWITVFHTYIMVVDILKPASYALALLRSISELCHQPEINRNDTCTIQPTLLNPDWCGP